MNNNGPMMIVAALAVIGGLGFFSYQEKEQSQPTNIQTVGARMDDCAKRSIKTVIGDLGCSNNKASLTRTTRAGGAVFMKPGS